MTDYERKFSGFIQMCAELKNTGTVAIVRSPEVLGDNYDEIRESLNRLAEAELALVILPVAQR